MRLVPIGDMKFGAGPERVHTSLAKRILAGQFPVGRSLKELEMDLQKSGFIDAKAAVDAHLVGASVACNVGIQIFMSEYVKYTDYQDGEEVVRWGVGIRFVFSAEMMDLSLKIDTLTGLAAAAELKMARVACSFHALGIQGAIPHRLLPKTLDTLEIKGLPKILESFDALRDCIYQEHVNIVPCLLAESGEARPASYYLNSPEFLATVLACQCIGNGYCLEDAKVELIRRRLPQEHLIIIDNVYQQIVKSRDPKERPQREERDAAKRQILHG
jgi:hypothetical protein